LRSPEKESKQRNFLVNARPREKRSERGERKEKREKREEEEKRRE
jgi:hypothetical protein